MWCPVYQPDRDHLEMLTFKVIEVRERGEVPGPDVIVKVNVPVSVTTRGFVENLEGMKITLLQGSWWLAVSRIFMITTSPYWIIHIYTHE